MQNIKWLTDICLKKSYIRDGNGTRWSGEAPPLLTPFRIWHSFPSSLPNEFSGVVIENARMGSSLLIPTLFPITVDFYT